ncbi:choline dehydrogenase-like flavoprotein [Gramella sp. Hel_I_59]|uniref:GMC oxidoreductase n=1 Tax=Gramella sp. Hel_I_59 TaxID=1249978 RepID=UPI0011545FE3|nr:GMC oxidoreductase [Gramella sp. Hel_I_59]TQI71940.1 choline dehydrogenase-like flavoprotein [Gramella sp. Hel_I_59]
MPFYNYNVDKITSDLLKKEVVIIGAGASGIMLALELLKLKISTVIIETGHFQEDEKRQVLNEVVQTGKKLENAVWGRKRAIGGTTIAWGGQSLPFSYLDFKKREYVANSGWPINFDSLKEYYKDANRFMGVDVMDYEGQIFSKLNIKRPNIDKNKLNYHASKWANEPNFRKKYKNQLENEVDVIYNAQVTEIIANKNKVEGIILGNFKGESMEAPIKKLVLATGAIEATRMMLHLSKKNKNFFSENGELIGKYFMDHPCMKIGSVKNIRDEYYFQKQFNTNYHKNRKYSFRISLSDYAQTKYKILNASLSLMFYYSNETEDPIYRAKSLVKTRNLSSLGWILKNWRIYYKMLVAYLYDGFLYKPNADVKLVVMAEQEPSLDSFISLSEEKDEFGQEKALINWNVSNKTSQSIKSIVKFFENYLNESGRATIEYFSDLDKINNNLLSDVNHFMGGTRMSKSEETGIVDENLKVWQTENLFVCSTSVFPTGSHSNPTLTLLALTQRLAYHLKSVSLYEK